MHADWQASTHRDHCRVTAPDESAAREFADFAFRIAAERQPDRTLSMSPWTNPERVTVASATGDGVRFSFPPLVEVPDNRNRANTVDDAGPVDDIENFDTTTPWMEYPSGEYIEQAVSYLKSNGFEVNDHGEFTGAVSHNGEDTVPTPTIPNKLNIGGATPSAGTSPMSTGGYGRGGYGEGPWGGSNDGDGARTVGNGGNGGDGSGNVSDGEDDSGDEVPVPPRVVVQRILSNPLHYRYIAKQLADALDSFQDNQYAYTERNTHPVWGTLEDPEELNELLREIRDELRRFNNILDNAVVSERQLEETTKSLRDKLRETLIAVANSTYGKTVQMGLGSLTVAYIYQFGLHLGLQPLDPANVDIIRKFLPGD